MSTVLVPPPEVGTGVRRGLQSTGFAAGKGCQANTSIDTARDTVDRCTLYTWNPCDACFSWKVLEG